MIVDHLLYNIFKDSNTTKCNITFGELFEVSPKFISPVTKGLKLEKDSIKIAGAIDNICTTTIIINNIDHTYKSKNKEPKEDDVAMVDVTVEGVKVKALIDSCSNLNVITNQFLRKLPSVYEPIGISRGRIRLATINDDYSEDYLINVPLQINNFHMVATCRVIDKEDPFFDIFINLKTQIDHKLFIHPILYSPCQFNDNGSVEEIAPINNQYENEEKLVCFVKAISNESIKKELKKMEGPPPQFYIHNEKFINTLNKKYRDQIIKFLEDNIVIIATSSEGINTFDLIST